MKRVKSIQCVDNDRAYVGRIAPTPSGHLHVGHAQTFAVAIYRSKIHNNTNNTSSGSSGIIKLRIEDLDGPRCKSKYLDEMLEDLLWFGLVWTNHLNMISASGGSDSNINKNTAVSNADGWKLYKTINNQYTFDFKQTDRMNTYKAAWYHLFTHGYIYPSPHTRKDVEASVSAPHEGDVEIIFPTHFRPEYMTTTVNANSANLMASTDSSNTSSVDICISNCDDKSDTNLSNSTDDNTPLTTASHLHSNSHFPKELQQLTEPNGINWRFKVPDGRKISFIDNRCGFQEYTCGVDFGDFVIWRGADSIPSYELAVVVDDIEMGVTEVVRGEDLLLSTSRQLLLYEALSTSFPSSSSTISKFPSFSIPEFYHCPLVRDETGKRLAKRSPTRTIRSLREEGYTPERIITEFFHDDIKALLLPSRSV